jgi:hypothetical protein
VSCIDSLEDEVVLKHDSGMFLFLLTDKKKLLNVVVKCTEVMKLLILTMTKLRVYIPVNQYSVVYYHGFES